MNQLGKRRFQGHNRSLGIGQRFPRRSVVGRLLHSVQPVQQFSVFAAHLYPFRPLCLTRQSSGRHTGAADDADLNTVQKQFPADQIRFAVKEFLRQRQG